MEILLLLAMFAVYVVLVKHTWPTPTEKSLCPPHSWNSVEVRDKAGEIQGYKLICTKCGPINRS